MRPVRSRQSSHLVRRPEERQVGVGDCQSGRHEHDDTEDASQDDGDDFSARVPLPPVGHACSYTPRGAVPSVADRESMTRGPHTDAESGRRSALLAPPQELCRESLRTGVRAAGRVALGATPEGSQSRRARLASSSRRRRAGNHDHGDCRGLGAVAGTVAFARLGRAAHTIRSRLDPVSGIRREGRPASLASAE